MQYQTGPLALNEIVAHATEAASGAAAILLSYFRKLEANQVEEKSSHRDLLSVADSEAEAHVIDAIQQRYPAHSILGEEKGFIEGSEDYMWVIDPLDGTTNFVRGFPFYAVSVGVLYGGVPVVGVVNAPSLGESFVAARGQGATCNGHAMKVSDKTELSRCVLATGFSYNRNEVERNNVDNFSSMILKVHDIRRAGAASIDLAFVAAGRFDGYWESYLAPWDVAAGALIVEEAGGRVSDYALREQPRAYIWNENILVSNGLIHDPLRAELSDVEEGYVSRFAKYEKRWMS